MSKDTNTGHCSTGRYSTGRYSTGDYSTGYHSTGNCSTGDYSNGYRSTGNHSTGYLSTGDRSTGYYSTGDRSTGDYSTGHCSTGDYSVGHFATEKYAPHGWFNVPSKVTWTEVDTPHFLEFDLTVWVTESIMSDAEKKENPTYKTTGGYLKSVTYKEAWAVFWRKTSEENRKKYLALPNFCPKIFKEITGIATEESEAKKKATKLRMKADKLLKQATALEQSL